MAYLLILLSFFSINSFAQAPTLVARASDIDGFPAAPMCFFSNNEMVIHQSQLLIHYTCVGSDLHDELWIGSKKIIQSSPGRLLNSAVSDGESVFATEYDEFGTRFLWQHDGASAQSHELPASWGDVQIHSLAGLKKKHLRFSMTNSEGINREGEWSAGGWKLNPARGISYFFTAASNEKMLIQKVRLGEAREWSESRPDEIQISIAPDFLPQTVVRDQQSDSTSPYLGFYNFSVLNGTRWAVFATRAEGIVAIVGENFSWREIPLYNFFSNVDIWPPAVTESGKFVLRATHKDGTLGLWIFENERPSLLLKSGDVIESDRGGGQVNGPIFYNAPIAHRDRIYIGVGLEQIATSLPLGQGIIEFSSR